MFFLSAAPRSFLLLSSSSASSPHTHVVHLSFALWLSTHAVHLTVPVGDDGQLMSGASCGLFILWLSTTPYS